MVRKKEVDEAPLRMSMPSVNTLQRWFAGC